MPLLEPTDRGLYCAAGDFFIDPWRSVPRAVVTHAHSDHARGGCGVYWCAERGKHVLQQRVGASAVIETARFGERRSINGVTVSLHPAGHILGSAQVRVEHGGEVWVVSGDYKTSADVTCDAFEPVKCHTFITESTFGLPIYQWSPESEVYAEINEWWRGNVARGRASVVFAYSLGKAQRVLAGLDPSIGPIGVHGAVAPFLPLYEAEGVRLPATIPALKATAAELRGRGMIVAPPGADNSAWLRGFGPIAKAFASGWMKLRGTRRRRALDRGFVLSDHADWAGLQSAIAATEAERIGVTHGYVEPLVRYLQKDLGKEAFAVATRYAGEGEGEEIDRVDPAPDDGVEGAAS